MAKKSRDSYFSCVSSFIKSQSLIKRLETSSDVVDNIQNEQNKSNENRILRGNNLLFILSYIVKI